MSDLLLLRHNIVEGNCLEKILRLNVPIHCVVTSPPYFNQRKYGDSPIEIGRESAVQDYINTLVSVFEKIPLHPQGSIWVNLADKRGKHGELLQVPKRFAVEMSNKGFLLADDVIWAKVIDEEDGTTDGGCMTEPAAGRLNQNGFEYLFRFVKTKKVNDAWTDTCAVRIPRVTGTDANTLRYLPKELMNCETATDGRNLHNVWRIGMGQTKEKHYAVYPPEICERPIAMTCPMFINPDGTPRRRIIKMVEYDEGRGSKRIFGKYSQEDNTLSGRQDTGAGYTPRKPETQGWEPMAETFTPGVVLDPFCGTGTTGEVALKLGRSFVGIELYPENVAIAKKRCADTIDWMLTNNVNPFLSFKQEKSKDGRNKRNYRL